MDDKNVGNLPLLRGLEIFFFKFCFVQSRKTKTRSKSAERKVKYLPPNIAGLRIRGSLAGSNFNEIKNYETK